MTLLLAGHDTTAAAFDWLWYCLAKHPDIVRRCQVEIDLAIGLRDPVIGDIPRLPMMTAAIQETLRLYPPAFAIFLRQATENLSIGAFSVPNGSLITTSPFVTHRDSRWFENPERFDPDRFLPPRAEAIPVHAYFPFGAGPRACIGQSFALAELTIVAATLLQRFDVCMAPSEPEPKLQVTMALRPRHPLSLRWTARAGVATVSSSEVNGRSNTGLTCRKLANL